MRSYKEFDFDISKIKTYKSKGISYYNLECAFDTETSSILQGDVKTGLCYIWMFGLGDSDKHIYYGRTLDEFTEFMYQLSVEFDLSNEKRLVVYVHNLSFDFQFIQKYLNWIEMFATAKRNPIKCCCDFGIEFRDSLVLSGYSLLKVGENLTKHDNIEKAVGDLDYKKVRSPITHLTEQEMYYCEQDIRVLLAYINEEIQAFGNITLIPLTNTGKVRLDVRSACGLKEYRSFAYKNDIFKSKWNKKINKFKDLIQSLKLTKEEYELAKDVYQGGFTHGDILYINETLKVGDEIKRLISKDFTSSYPTVMIAEKYPMTSPIPVELDLEKALKYINSKNFGFMTRIKMWNVESDFVENYLSFSKCKNVEKPVLNNGRILRCDYLETSVSDLDLDIILKTYTFSKIEFFESYELKLQYLPTPIVATIIDYYNDKTTLKDVDGKEAEYMNAKGKLNSIYGMCVMDLYKPEILFENGLWSVDEDSSVQDVIDKVQSSHNRFLYYLWGVWVSAYARHNLWTGILASENAFVYSDTDSIKIAITEENDQAMNDYFDNYNKEVLNKLKVACEYHHLDFERLQPYTVDGVQKPLGVWDDDGDYLMFKTLGAKRYLTYDTKGKLKLTCAGVSKINGLKYLCKISGVEIDKKGHILSGDVQKVFDNFNFYLKIPSYATGKMTHYYNDDTMMLTVKDYLGTTEKFETKGGVYLEEASFNLNINEVWLELIQDTLLKNEELVFSKRGGY